MFDTFKLLEHEPEIVQAVELRVRLGKLVSVGDGILTSYVSVGIDGDFSGVLAFLIQAEELTGRLVDVELAGMDTFELEEFLRVRFVHMLDELGEIRVERVFDFHGDQASQGTFWTMGFISGSK
jgi:hypothetical protein